MAIEPFGPKDIIVLDAKKSFLGMQVGVWDVIKLPSKLFNIAHL